MLSCLYTDVDLLVAQCLREGLWDDLDARSLATVVAGIVFEGRQREEAPRLPGGAVRQALEATAAVAGDVQSLEAEHDLKFQRELDFGFVWPMHRWVAGARLSSVLQETDLAAGDFIRWARQVIDLLDQIADALPPDSAFRARARSAIDLVDRGIVAYSTVM